VISGIRINVTFHTIALREGTTGAVTESAFITVLAKAYQVFARSALGVRGVFAPLLDLIAHCPKAT